MKDFFIVLKFELMNFVKNKSFIISTLVICILIAIGLSIPTIKDTFFPGDNIEEPSMGEEIQDEELPD